MQTSRYEAIKLSGTHKKHLIDTVVVEAPLQININGNPYTVVMRTPGEDEYLIRGLLYAEDIYKGEENFEIEIIENTANNFSIVNITIDENLLGQGYMNKRTLLSVSSCGICGKQSLDAIKVSGSKLMNTQSIDSSLISKMFETMKENQATFKLTGASHASAIFDANYKLLAVNEDLGRHNAVDKVIGELLNKNRLSESQFILVSGRVSYEIVTKAFIAKIKTIIAVSGCSSLAIDFTKEFGIELIGFSRGSNSTIYNQ